MNSAIIVLGMAGVVIVARWLMELGLAQLNRRHVLAHADEVPDAFKDMMDQATYARSVQYTLAKGRFGQIEDSWRMIVLLVVLFSGVLPWGFGAWNGWLGDSAWTAAAFLFVVGLLLSLTELPFDWYLDFRLEQRFGFNTMTPRVWWADRVKGLLLASLLGYPLLALMLKFVEWTGAAWWLWAWAALLGFQLVLSVLAPVLILPLFNKFTPLPEGELRERLTALAQRTGFRARSLEVMDGSKRSRHSNAFFTGLGRFRKIVLFDTLIQQLTGPELEAVLAHEIGHFKLKHILKMLAVSAVGSLAMLGLVAWLARSHWFAPAFGFASGQVAPVLLLCGLLGGVVSFWLSPVAHWWSRRHEYEADAFAAKVMNSPRELIGALRKLHEKNLGNLTPHPLYSGFYYSHPSLPEREKALLAGA